MIMRLSILAAAVLLPLSAHASGFSAEFDCGENKRVTVINYKGNIELVVRTEARFDKEPIVIHTVSYDVDKNSATLDEAVCRLMTEEETREERGED